VLKRLVAGLPGRGLLDLVGHHGKRCVYRLKVGGQPVRAVLCLVGDSDPIGEKIQIGQRPGGVRRGRRRDGGSPPSPG